MYEILNLLFASTFIFAFSHNFPRGFFPRPNFTVPLLLVHFQFSHYLPASFPISFFTAITHIVPNSIMLYFPFLVLNLYEIAIKCYQL